MVLIMALSHFQPSYICVLSLGKACWSIAYKFDFYTMALNDLAYYRIALITAVKTFVKNVPNFLCSTDHGRG
jgi:hypothetical protein